MRHRHAISDDDWNRIADRFARAAGPARQGRPRTTACSSTRSVGSLEPAAPWRDLPERFGNWNSTWRRFDRWACKRVWRRVFEDLPGPRLGWLILDSTIIRAPPLRPAGRATGTGPGARTNRPSDAAEPASEPGSTGPSAAWGCPSRLIRRRARLRTCRRPPPCSRGSPVEVVVAQGGYDSKAVVEAIEAKRAEGGDPEPEEPEGAAKLRSRSVQGSGTSPSGSGSRRSSTAGSPPATTRPLGELPGVHPRGLDPDPVAIAQPTCLGHLLSTT